MGESHQQSAQHLVSALGWNNQAKGNSMNGFEQHEPVPPLGTPTAGAERTAGFPKHLAFGAGGVVVGMLVGMLAGYLGGSASVGAQGPSGSKAVTAAVATCEAEGLEGITVLDGGASLDMRTSGEEADGAPYEKVACVLAELKAPESLRSRMGSTRALDGTVDGKWDGFSATWNYHPDDGMRVIVESVQK